jgi:hypothetical protein
MVETFAKQAVDPLQPSTKILGQLTFPPQTEVLLPLHEAHGPLAHADQSFVFA